LIQTQLYGTTAIALSGNMHILALVFRQNQSEYGVVKIVQGAVFLRETTLGGINSPCTAPILLYSEIYRGREVEDVRLFRLSGKYVF
jgi:hypothetical protein